MTFTNLSNLARYGISELGELEWLEDGWGQW